MEKLKFLIVGLGNQGTFYARLFLEGKIKNGELAAVCDADKARIAAFSDRFSFGGKTYLDYRSAYEDGGFNAVIVATPHYSHAEIVTFFLDRNVNVLCDKPAGVYAKQVEAMNESARRSKATFSMMFNQRTSPVYALMRQMIASGKLGKVTRVVWQITDWFRTESYYKSGGWRATWKGEGGGVLINQCPHQLDLLVYILGKLPKAVNAFCGYGKWHDVEVEDDVTAYMEYDDGATGVFIATTGEAPGKNLLEISGTLGRLVCENGTQLTFYKNEIDSLVFSKTSEQGFSKPNVERVQLKPQGDNAQHVGIINNFTNAVLGLETLFVDGTEGILSVQLMNAMELSGWEGGKRVSIPVDPDEYLKKLNKLR